MEMVSVCKGDMIIWLSPLFGECQDVVGDVLDDGRVMISNHPVTGMSAIIQPEWILKTHFWDYSEITFPCTPKDAIREP